MSTDVLDQIKSALRGPDASIHIVVAFNLGHGAQVKVKTRKVGPVIFPAEGQTLADVLGMLGGFVEDRP